VNFRTKVLVLQVGMAVLTMGVTVVLLAWNFSRMLQERLGSQVLSVAATTAAFLDGDLHNEAVESGDKRSAAYISLRDAIRRARDANRRDDFFVKYAYTLTVRPDEPTLIRFGLDVEEDESIAADIGEPYRTTLSNPFDVAEYQFDRVFTTDAWGEFLSANAPIKDSKGKPVAALGIDVESSFVKERMARVWNIAGTAFAGALIVAVVISFLISNHVSKPLSEIRRTVEALGRGELSARAHVHTKDEFESVGEAINTMGEGLQERAVLRTAIERYVPYNVADSIVHSPDAPLLRGERRKVTVLFADLRGFTKLAETKRPEEVVSFLNRCSEVMSSVIEKNHGTLDKFVGDGMMATFGAPEDDPFQEEHAVQAALALQSEMSRLTVEPGDEHWAHVRVGVGINSGNAVVGSMGSSRHMEYTAIGDTVNCAACIEEATKDFGADIVISEYTYNAVRGLFKTRKLGPLIVKGRADEVMVYAVDSLEEEPVSEVNDAK
jgi:adenylate cyclase